MKGVRRFLKKFSTKFNMIAKIRLLIDNKIKSLQI